MDEVLAERCERLRQPVLEMTTSSIGAVYRPDDVPALIAVTRRVRSIVAEDASDIDSAAFRDWQAIGVAMLDGMIERLEAGDAAGSYKRLTEPAVGIIRLGESCAGFPGW